MSQEEIVAALEANRKKVWAVSKMAKIGLHVETLKSEGLPLEDVKSLAMAFAKWQNTMQRDLMRAKKQTALLQRSQIYKSAIQTFAQGFSKASRLEEFFNRWKNVLSIEKRLHTDG